MAKKTKEKTSKKSGKGKAVEVNFSDTESRGGSKGMRSAQVPPNDYAVKVIKAELTTSSEKETPGIRVVFKITQGKYKGKELVDNLWLTKKSLWRVRQALEAMGITVPSSKFKVEPSKLVGTTCAITVDDEEYDGKVRSRVVDTFRLADFEEDEDDGELAGDEDDEDSDDDDDDDDEDSSDDDDDDEDSDDDDDDDDEDLELDDV